MPFTGKFLFTTEEGSPRGRVSLVMPSAVDYGDRTAPVLGLGRDNSVQKDAP